MSEKGIGLHLAIVITSVILFGSPFSKASDGPRDPKCTPTFLSRLLARVSGVASGRDAKPIERISILSELPPSQTAGPQSKIILRSTVSEQDRKLGFTSLEYNSERGSWNHFPHQYSNVGNDAKVVVITDGVPREVSGRIIQEYKGVIDILDKEGQVHRILVNGTEFKNFRVRRSAIEWREGGNTIHELISEIEDSYEPFVIARVPVNAEGEVITKQVGTGQRYEYISGAATLGNERGRKVVLLTDYRGVIHRLDPRALNDSHLSGLVLDSQPAVEREFIFKAPAKLKLPPGFEDRFNNALRRLESKLQSSHAASELKEIRKNLTPGLIDAIERATAEALEGEKAEILRAAGLNQDERELLLSSGMCEH